MTEANAVLDRFAPQLRWVVDSVKEAFDLLDHEIDDLRQEARMYVLCYAGIYPWPRKPGRHFDLLTTWEQGSVRNIPSMLATQLRLDLSEAITRAKHRLPMMSDSMVNELIESDKEPSEPSHETESDNQMDEARYLKQYPEFAMMVLDGLSQEQIAVRQGCTDRTVRNRIAGQKRSFLSTQLRRRGIVVEGDETMDELEEAYGYSRIVR